MKVGHRIKYYHALDTFNSCAQQCVSEGNMVDVDKLKGFGFKATLHADYPIVTITGKVNSHKFTAHIKDGYPIAP